MNTSYYYRQWRAYSLRLLVILLCIAWFALLAIGLMLFGEVMLFRWEGKPYRSKQIEIAPVFVTAATAIDLWLDPKTGRLCHSEIMGLDRPLWQCFVLHL